MLHLVLAAAAAVAATLPAPVSGDFDHDGNTDVAAVVEVNDGYALVVRPGAAGRAPVTIASFSGGEAARTFVGKAAPGVLPTACAKGAGRATEPCPRKTVTLAGDVLDFGTDESTRAVALWTGKAFEVVWLED
jgi:hypothetical protein